MPGDRRAPVVADNHKPLVVQGVGNTDHILGQLDDIIRLNGLGPVAAAIAALVRHRNLKAGLDQRVDLVPPQIPALREAVEKNHQRPRALNHGPQPDTVCLNQLKIPFLHRPAPSRF